MPSTWGIVVAAGSGTRFTEGTVARDADSPKQFTVLGGARVVDHAVRAALDACDAVVLVLAPGVAWDGAAVAAVVIGGATRADSVRAGLAAIPESAEIVVVHDAARPLAPRRLFDAVVAAVDAGADAAIPAVPVIDTIKRVDGDRVLATVPRDDLVAAQTPQAFRARTLRAAHASAPDASDDAGLIEACGGTVVIVPGEATNMKVTTPGDLVVASALLASWAGHPGRAPDDR